MKKNKRTLVKLLKESWSNSLAHELQGRQVILIHEHEDIPEMSEALKLTSADGATTVKEKIPSLDSS